ncbi:MAG: hypothetical protein HY690_12630 [Chloroflexi bacterium]|nr:hypothetical protein [Chloroflexota bacterium]
MTRGNRAVAQRYAAAAKKRRKSIQHVPSLPPSPREESASAPATPAAPARAASPVAVRPQPTRAAATRRSFADYAEQYRYVWKDLRRIALLVGALLLGLILLSFVLR